MKTALAVMLLVIATVVFAETNPSLATALTPDGRIMEGVSGSFDPTGFRMAYGADGEPLFVEDGSPPWEPVHPPDGQDSEGTWYPLGSGVNDHVYAIAVSGSDVYAGGYFTVAGGNPANCIARWDDANDTWHALGSGVNDFVYAIAVSGSDVYAGGYFTVAGGNPANCIARWDGSSWHPLGSGTGGVHAIAVSGSDVFVGGLLFQAGGNPANRIARWDGSSWHPLGSGVNDYVYAIAVSGSDVYAGGYFTVAGGNPANYIARWDGSSWHPLGNGVNDHVYAIAVSGSDVYAGGWFDQAGGNPANRIARWDGSSWHPLGSGMNDVDAIAVSGSDVYAGGNFTVAGGNPANRIARWDGSSWHALGSGLSDEVHAIAVSGSDVYAGGRFFNAGGNPASRIARWVPLVPITVTEPDSSTTWIHFDTDLPVEWNYPAGRRMFDLHQPLSGDEVTILLYNAGDLVDTLITGADNTGSWVFAGPVPMDWTPGEEYRIYIEDNLGNYGWSVLFAVAGFVDTDPRGETALGVFQLFPVSPNPSMGEFAIGYSVPIVSDVAIGIYDVSGRLVCSAAEGEHAEGLYDLQLSGFSAGLYFCRMRAESFASTERFVVIR